MGTPSCSLSSERGLSHYLISHFVGWYFLCIKRQTGNSKLSERTEPKVQHLYEPERRWSGDRKRMNSLFWTVWECPVGGWASTEKNNWGVASISAPGFEWQASWLTGSPLIFTDKNFKTFFHDPARTYRNLEKLKFPYIVRRERFGQFLRITYGTIIA